jgi:hypothetical protein
MLISGRRSSELLGLIDATSNDGEVCAHVQPAASRSAANFMML